MPLTTRTDRYVDVMAAVTTELDDDTLIDKIRAAVSAAVDDVDATATRFVNVSVQRDVRAEVTADDVLETVSDVRLAKMSLQARLESYVDRLAGDLPADELDRLAGLRDEQEVEREVRRLEGAPSLGMFSVAGNRMLAGELEELTAWFEARMSAGEKTTAADVNTRVGETLDRVAGAGHGEVHDTAVREVIFSRMSGWAERADFDRFDLWF